MPQSRMHLAEDQSFVIEGLKLRPMLAAINGCPGLNLDGPFHTVAEAFHHFHWEPGIETISGELTDIDPHGTLDHVDTEVLFALVAPFVTPGSFIEIIDERGGNWRYQFDGTAVHVCLPVITWEVDHALNVAELTAA